MTKKKPAPKKTKKGRPSLYTEALAAKICWAHRQTYLQ